VNHPDEAEWVRKAQTGDQAAFALLVDRYWERLRRWLYGLTGRVHASEDLTQEAFTKAWASLPRLQAEETFRVWLFRIARNCLLDSKRGPRGTDAKPLPENLGGKEPEPLGELIDQEAQKMLVEALGKLGTQYQAAYLLWTHEDMPYHQIARVLSITEETARWRVCKARQSLARQLRAYLDDQQR
jgi:RNA polymerase sigma-70 factor (ECF subfamily)